MSLGTVLAIQNTVELEKLKKQINGDKLNQLMRKQPLIEAYAATHDLSGVPTDVFQRRSSPQQAVFTAGSPAC